MLKFYREYAERHVKDELQSNQRRMHTKSLHIPTGFWLRRMADDTDRMLWKMARLFAKKYDPELAKTLR